MSSILERHHHHTISAQSSSSSSIDGGYSSSSSSSLNNNILCDQRNKCHHHHLNNYYHHHINHHHHNQYSYEGFINNQNIPILNHHHQRNYCKLIFKILIVLLSFAGFLYQATDICAHYFSYRTVVYTNTEQDSLVDLPSITFCLPTYFTKKSLEQLYSQYIKRNLDEMYQLIKQNQSILDSIKPVIYETFQKQAFKDLSAAQILDRSVSDDGIIECRLFYPPQHWNNLTRERMYEIIQYGLPCEEVTQVISSINANGKCFTFFSQLLTDNDSLKAYQTQHNSEQHQILEYQQYPQMTSFASSSASSASTRSTGPVAPPIVQHSRYVPVSHKISVNHGYRFHSGRFIRLQIQFNRNEYTLISDGHQRECIQVHPPFKIPSEACIHSINPGMSYDFVLTKTKAILQPPPYQTNCQSYQAVTQAESELLASTSDPNELKEFYLKPMSRSDCIDKCMIHIYEKYCGCLPIHISIWQRSSLFLNMSVCDYEDFERIAPCLEKELSSTCYDTCKSDCIDRHYHLHVESRIYPSDEQIKQSNGVERIRLKRLRQNAATISIWSNYLSDITYVHTPVMSLIQLICYLGGLAGLWLGVSVMTVSGWLAQLYPFMQKWNYKQRYILLTAKENLRYFYDTFRYRQQQTTIINDSTTSSKLSHQYPQSYDDCCLNHQFNSNHIQTCCLIDPHHHHHHQNICCIQDVDSNCVNLINNQNHNQCRISKELHHQQSSSSESTNDTPNHQIQTTENTTTTTTTATLQIDDGDDADNDDDDDDDLFHNKSTKKLSFKNLKTLDNDKNLVDKNLDGNVLLNLNENNDNNNNGNGGNNINNNINNIINKQQKLQQQQQNNYNFRSLQSHPNTIARRAIYWSNYSSMSTSSDDLSVISSSTNSTNISNNSGINLFSNNNCNQNQNNNSSTILRRLSLINSTNPAISNLFKYSYRV